MCLPGIADAKVFIYRTFLLMDGTTADQNPVASLLNIDNVTGIGCRFG
jgi:hypothetical protein